VNYVYRLYLKNPYQGRETLVMKYGRPYVKSYLTLAFATERQVSNISFCSAFSFFAECNNRTMKWKR
jgi:hypothetical protein